jgi:hypothetical protein
LEKTKKITAEDMRFQLYLRGYDKGHPLLPTGKEKRKVLVDVIKKIIEQNNWTTRPSDNVLEERTKTYYEQHPYRKKPIRLQVMHTQAFTQPTYSGIKNLSGNQPSSSSSEN